MYKNPVRTSQETLYISTTKPNRLMLFGETVAVYCENTFCGQKTQFQYVKAGSKHSNRWALKG
jgi:hypothetical protein